MNEQVADQEEFNWRLPMYAIAAASVLLLLLFVWSADADLLYILIVAPIACLVSFGLIIASAVRRKFRRSLRMVLMLALFLSVSGILLRNETALRPGLRWFLFARNYKAQVIAQPIPPNGELKHVEWDGWGGVPVGDWTAYVVFDPTDSLSAAARSNSSGEFKGNPVQRRRYPSPRKPLVLCHSVDERILGKQLWNSRETCLSETTNNTLANYTQTMPP